VWIIGVSRGAATATATDGDTATLDSGISLCHNTPRKYALTLCLCRWFYYRADISGKSIFVRENASRKYEVPELDYHMIRTCVYVGGTSNKNKVSDRLKIRCGAVASPVPRHGATGFWSKDWALNPTPFLPCSLFGVRSE